MKKVLLAGILTALVLAAANPLRAYVNGKILNGSGAIVLTKWKTTAFPITWQMNPTQGANVTGDRSQAAVFAASFQTWQNLTTASISFTQGANTDASLRSPASDGKNVI